MHQSEYKEKECICCKVRGKLDKAKSRLVLFWITTAQKHVCFGDWWKQYRTSFSKPILVKVINGNIFFIFSVDEPERPKPPNVKIATNWKLEQLLSQWRPFQVTRLRDNQVNLVIQLLWSQRAIHLIALCSLAFVQADLIAYAVVETLLPFSGGGDKTGSRNLRGTKARDEEFQVGETRKAKIQREIRISRNKNIKET